MLRKIPLVSAAALIALAAVISAAIFLQRHDAASVIKPPEKVTVYLEDKGEIRTVEYIDFITGCVYGMMSPDSETEALKCSACAANTTALYHIANKTGFQNNGADFSDRQLPYITPEDAEEKYGAKYGIYLDKVNEAAESGMASVILYEGQPICAACCQISAGKTDNSADTAASPKPYLSSVSCSFDKEANGYESTAAFTSDMVYKALRDIAPQAVLSGHPEEWFTEPEYTKAGTLTGIMYGGVKLSGAELRKSLGLRSAAVSIIYTEDRFTFTCKGLGDNLGMSLYGANCLARQGMKMTDILLYFYKDCEVA